MLKVGVPYCIIKRKASLGHLVYRKTGITATFTQVNSRDKGTLVEAIGPIMTDMTEICHHWGDKILGLS